MTFPKNTRYRKKRKYNPVKGLLSILILLVIGIFLYFAGHFLIGSEGVFAHLFQPQVTASGKANSGTSMTPNGNDKENQGSTSQNGMEPSNTQDTETNIPTPTPAPTPPPTPEPMTQSSDDPAVIRMSWETPAVFNGTNAFPESKQTLTTSKGSLDYWVFQNNKPATTTGTDVFFPSSFQETKNTESSKSVSGSTDSNKAASTNSVTSAYTSTEGVLTFRGNHFRDAPSFGNRSITEKKLEIIWDSPTGAISTTESYWPGTGWTGQPLLVHWAEETRKAMNINEELKSKDLVEVIYPTLDGNIYYLDLENGNPSREKQVIGFPFKGTASIDPRGYPILYAGQGLNENGQKVTEFKLRIINLLNQTEEYAILGRDPIAFRPWGAFDSSALINAETDTLISCAENGLVYKVKLNAAFEAEEKKLTLAPQITKYRYHVQNNPEIGIESSPAAYENYLYFADNGGILQCLDLNTMKPVWFVETNDDTDCTTTIEKSADGVFLYTANEVDKRSEEGKVKIADCNIRKYNALTGELLWQVDVPCVYQYYINGGALATPLVGKNDISDMIIFNIALTGDNQSGQLLALDKKTGNTVWKRDLTAYSWSSPVDVLSDDGSTYGLFCDFAGWLHLFDPKTGKDYDRVSLGGNIESSPAVYNDMVVVGSYAKKIFGIKIK